MLSVDQTHDAQMIALVEQVAKRNRCAANFAFACGI
jgi:hypothetical protein